MGRKSREREKEDKMKPELCFGFMAPKQKGRGTVSQGLDPGSHTHAFTHRASGCYFAAGSRSAKVKLI